MSEPVVPARAGDEARLLRAGTVSDIYTVRGYWVTHMKEGHGSFRCNCPQTHCFHVNAAIRASQAP